MHPYQKFPSGIFFYSKISHRMFWNPQRRCKLCVKDGQVSSRNVLKSCRFCLMPNLCQKYANV